MESLPRFRSGPSSNCHKHRHFYAAAPTGFVLGIEKSGLAAVSRRSYGSLHIGAFSVPGMWMWIWAGSYTADRHFAWAGVT